MKKLMNLEGVKLLSKLEQKSIHGAGSAVCAPCAGKSSGDNCYYNCHKACPGQCGNVPGSGLTCIPL